jgi:hypothetical protein
MIHEAGARDWTATSYDGELWIDPSSFDVQRFSMRTSELSPETNACEARMISDYARVRFESSQKQPV